ncbi:MAG: hypothetical protein I8H71_00335 [Xanthomonadaceae bacterium]|nr:hypothetical protein [Xanthomonadaceae bacterium]MBH2008120.1 hypothetical protein [Xanthomonadaceae bacterium]
MLTRRLLRRCHLAIDELTTVGRAPLVNDIGHHCHGTAPCFNRLTDLFNHSFLSFKLKSYAVTSARNTKTRAPLE